MPVIELNNVWKKFKKGEKFYSLRDQIPHLFNSFLRRPDHKNQLEQQEFWALKNIDFKLERGEVLGIIGPNGAGKSTLLNILAGIIQPTMGEYKVNGRLSAIIEITAGFHPDFTGRENVYFNGAILGMTRKEVDRKFDEIVDFSGIREFIDTPVKRYSSGMSARLGFAVAAHVDPDVLLVDEVLSVGDLAFQAKCTEKMKELVNKGVTVILISHHLALIDILCQKAILLEKGQVSKEGTPQEVISFYENLVRDRSEQELDQELKKVNQDLESQEGMSGRIVNVTMFDRSKQQKDTFLNDESISMKIEYEFDDGVEIEDPVFSVEVMRTDGVVCCESNTISQNFPITEIAEKGTIWVEFDPMRFMPNVYFTKITIWDEDMIKPHAMAKKGVFKIESKVGDSAFDSLIDVPSKWKFNS